jgi:dihydroxy-acid dehydratase
MRNCAYSITKTFRYAALRRMNKRQTRSKSMRTAHHRSGHEGQMSKPTVGLDQGLTNYGDRDFSRYMRRSFAQSMGYSRAMLDKPVIGIAYTGSDFNNCHRHFPELLAAVKRGVLASGALPLEFPTISLGEVFLTPTSLKYRNLMAIDTEEMIRAQPMDAVVLMGGCDKTVPAQLMGAVSADRPAIALIGGPMMTASGRAIARATSMPTKSPRSKASSR